MARTNKQEMSAQEKAFVVWLKGVKGLTLGAYHKKGKATQESLLKEFIAGYTGAQVEEPKEAEVKADPVTEEPKDAEKTEEPAQDPVEEPKSHKVYKMKDKSLELTDAQYDAIEAIPETWEIRVWAYNKTMIWAYYKGVCGIEVMTAKKLRVSTRPQYRVEGMVDRSSGYGLDATIVCDDNAHRQEVLKALVSQVESLVNAKEQAKEEKAKKKAEKEAKESK